MVKPVIRTLEIRDAIKLLRKDDPTLQSSELVGNRLLKTKWPGFDGAVLLDFEDGNMSPGGKPLRQQVEVGLIGGRAAFYHIGDLNFELRGILRVRNNRKFIQYAVVRRDPVMVGRKEGDALEGLAKEVVQSYLAELGHKGDWVRIAREVCEGRASDFGAARAKVKIPVPYKLKVRESRDSVTMFAEARTMEISSFPLREDWDELRIKLTDYASFILVSAVGWDPAEEKMITEVLNTITLRHDPQFENIAIGAR
jgi:hypothetical protein